MQKRTKNKKRIEICLNPEEMDLLESLSIRFNITKVDVIRQALKVFASKRKHYLTLSYREINIEEDGHSKGSTIRATETRNKEQISQEEWNKVIESIQEEPKQELQDTKDNDLPF